MSPSPRCVTDSPGTGPPLRRNHHRPTTPPASPYGRAAGLLGCRAAGLPGCRAAGLPGCWAAGAQRPGPRKASRDRHPLHRLVDPSSGSFKQYGGMISAMDVWRRIRAVVATRDQEIRALRSAFGPPWRHGRHRRPAWPRSLQDWTDIAREFGIRRKRIIVYSTMSADVCSDAGDAEHPRRRLRDQKHHDRRFAREAERQQVQGLTLHQATEPEIDPVDLENSKNITPTRPQPRYRRLGTTWRPPASRSIHLWTTFYLYTSIAGR